MYIFPTIGPPTWLVMPARSKAWATRQRSEISATAVIVFPHREKTIVPVPSVPAIAVMLAVWNAQPTPSVLRRRISALYHYQLLPAATSAWQCPESEG